MKYMMLIYGNQETWDAAAYEDWPAIIAAMNAYNAKYFATGEMLGAYGVADQIEARTVRIVDGVAAITDGPYIEAKEYIGSFSIIECADLDRALAIAADMPWAKIGPVEIRPLEHEAESHA